MTPSDHQQTESLESKIKQLKADVAENKFYGFYDPENKDAFYDKELAFLALKGRPSLIHYFPDSIKKDKELMFSIAKELEFKYNDDNTSFFAHILNENFPEAKKEIIDLLNVNSSSYGLVFQPFYKASRMNSTLYEGGKDAPMIEIALAYLKYVKKQKDEHKINMDMYTLNQEFPYTLKTDKNFVVPALKLIPELYSVLPKGDTRNGYLFNDVDVLEAVFSTRNLDKSLRTYHYIDDEAKKRSTIVQDIGKEALKDREVISFLIKTCPLELDMSMWAKDNEHLYQNAFKGHDNAFYDVALKNLDDLTGTVEYGSLDKDRYKSVAFKMLEETPLEVLKTNVWNDFGLKPFVKEMIAKREITTLSKESANDGISKIKRKTIGM